MAYLCTGVGFEEITRIFQSDGSVFELWSKKQKTAPDLMFIGNWKFSKNEKPEVIFDRMWQQQIANGKGGSIKAITRNSELIVEVDKYSMIEFHQIGGGRFRCAESPSATQEAKQFAQQADKVVNAAHKKDGTRTAQTNAVEQVRASDGCPLLPTMNGGKPLQITALQAWKEMWAARERAIRAIRLARSSSEFCRAQADTMEQTVAQYDGTLANQRDVIKNQTARGEKVDPGYAVVMCHSYAQAARLLSGCK